ncbi:MAG TPA: DUF4129 domain-containing protein [Chloroflexaceae bacterium]|nr:DUF4129 domain-containing protein [Chloroflexaceae bacterium]
MHRPSPRPLAGRLLTALATLLAALALAAPAVAQGPGLGLDAYERLLREARAAAARGDRLDVEQAAAAFVGAREVVMPDGSLAPVDNAWLAAELARPAPDLPMVAARLGALIDALAVAAPPAPPDAAARLEAILERPPFAERAAPPAEPGPLDRFLDWLFEQLGRAFEPVADAAAGAPGTAAGWAATALGAALVLAVLALWLRGLRRALRAEAALPPPAALEARDTADAQLRARALAGAGDYRGAARLMALAALLWLDERGVLPYDPHQTNREHLGRLGAHPTARAGLAPIVATADRVWYGGAPLDAAGYAEVEAQVEALRAVEGRRGQA